MDDAIIVRETMQIEKPNSERKTLESAHAETLVNAVSLLQERGAFLSHMSHVLRTPLNAILGFTQLLKLDESLSNPQLEQVNIIHDSGEELLSTINDILDYANLEGNNIALNVNNISLEHFLNGIVDIIRVKADQKKLLFFCVQATDLPKIIRGDEQRLRQVLLKLLDNAVKITDHGQVSLQVGFTAPDRVSFAVRDSGIGIDESQLDIIFQPFEQLNENPLCASGTGLGLAISRQLVRLMGGEIEVESRVGNGSLFSFELAMEAMHAEPMASGLDA